MAPIPAQPALKDLVDNFVPGGSYGIEWQLSGDFLTYKAHYNPQWRLDAVKAGGLNSLYTERSMGFQFLAGQGFVGRTFARQEVLFVRDLQAADKDNTIDAMQGGGGVEFLRADLAKEFDLHSAIFLPLPNGVLEIGSCALVTALPQHFAPYAGSSTPALATSPAVPGVVDAPSVAPPPFLQKLVEELSMAGCYGIEWKMEGDSLKCHSHFNPQWRVEGLRQQGFKGAYTTQSRGFTFARGEGLVGSVFAEQSVLFVRDAQEVTPEEVKTSMQSGSGSAFARAGIARDFGIHSMLFLPLADSVLEVGSVWTYDDIKGFLSEPAAKAVGGKTDAADILSSLQALACRAN